MRIRFFILSFIILIFIGILIIIFRDNYPRDVVEKIGGLVSESRFEDGKPVLYLDVTPDFDNNNDGNNNSGKDVWISAYDEQILRQLAELNVGDYIYAKDLWKADESWESVINHYYILEFYETKRR